MPVAAAALGTTLEVLRPGEATAMLLGALVTVAVTAALAGRIKRMAGSAPTSGQLPGR